MRRIASLLCLLALTGSALAQTPPPAPAAAPGAAPGGRGDPGGPPQPSSTPYDFNAHPGWISMFDGKTLKDWAGPMDIWHVENGTITATGTVANPIGSVYLYWTGGKVKDFEFKTEIKLSEGGANSGIQFRALRLPKTAKKNSEWESVGYQADYTQSPGSMIECCRGSTAYRNAPGSGDEHVKAPRPGDSARVGTVTRAALGEGLNPTVLASLGDSADLQKFVRKGDWNEVHLIVRGRTLQYIINGHLMSELIDDNPDIFSEQGEISIQLEGGPPNTVAFRNMWIKPLP